jgi:hypothetical protein
MMAVNMGIHPIQPLEHLKDQSPKGLWERYADS